MLYAAYQPQLDILLQVSFTETNGGQRLQVACSCLITVYLGCL
jgi:hypothetical protein